MCKVKIKIPRILGPEWAPTGLRAPEAGIQAINLAWWVALIQLNPTESSGFGFHRFYSCGFYCEVN
jgi:hypothetical protein